MTNYNIFTSSKGADPELINLLEVWGPNLKILETNLIGSSTAQVNIVVIITH